MTTTPNLGLTQYAKTDTMNFLTQYNTDLDKIDTTTGKLSNLTTSSKTNLVSATNENVTNIGTLANLKTLDKASLVGAINEIMSNFKSYMYRVGDIIFSTSPTNPSSEYGGTWVAWGGGKVPVGVDVNDIEFNNVEKIGGNKNHLHGVASAYAKLSSAGGAIVSAWQSAIPWVSTWRVGNPAGEAVENYSKSDGVSLGGTTDYTSCMPPFVTCYIWKKTA